MVNRECTSDDKKDFTDDTNSVKSTTDLWQKYSPIAWSEMYSEFVKYTKRMTQISTNGRDNYFGTKCSKEKVIAYYSSNVYCYSMRAEGDILDWSLDARGENEIVIVIKKLTTKRNS